MLLKIYFVVTLKTFKSIKQLANNSKEKKTLIK